MATERIALVTCASLAGGTDDDAILAGALAQVAEPTFVAWDDPDFDWAGPLAVVLRSTWDYHRRSPEFLQWVDRVRASGATLLNPPDLVHWNARKTYLKELEAQGAQIVPTYWLDASAIGRLPMALSAAGWERAVIKPVVAATSHHTHAITEATVRGVTEELSSVDAPDGFMLQPFVAEVVDPGEWSLMFFDGEFSHAVLKTPASGDFRVQDDFGGTSAPGHPGDAIVEQARAILDTLPERPLYARVDGVVQSERFVLIELELIEPVLFSGHDDASARRLAQALALRLDR